MLKHLPTGKIVKSVLRVENGRSFCDFGDASNQFTWVRNAELGSNVCAVCGDTKPFDQSCGCFDNHCQ